MLIFFVGDFNFFMLSDMSFLFTDIASREESKSTFEKKSRGDFAATDLLGFYPEAALYPLL